MTDKILKILEYNEMAQSLGATTEEIRNHNGRLNELL